MKPTEIPLASARRHEFDREALRGRSCPICGRGTMYLPTPNSKLSLLSDGRLISKPLAKISCLSCGAVSHATELVESTVRKIYEHDYELSQVAKNSDAGRARAYADWLTNEVAPPSTVLEIGCGSGALLRELSVRWPDAMCIGVDPALRDQPCVIGNVRLERSFVEDLSKEIGNFDLIVAVNVIEHSRQPSKFIAGLKNRLNKGGHIAIICPVGDPPNVEMLFYDHLYTLTPFSLGVAAANLSLTQLKSVRAPQNIGDFQMSTFGPGNAGIHQSNKDFRRLFEDRRAYLENWVNLDTALLSRIGPAKRLVVFGGGQTASLFRAYAPQTWEKIDAIVLDDLQETWKFDKTVSCYKDVKADLKEAAVLIATSPNSQSSLAMRLLGDGLQPIRFDDLIIR